MSIAEIEYRLNDLLTRKDKLQRRREELQAVCTGLSLSHLGALLDGRCTTIELLTDLIVDIDIEKGTLERRRDDYRFKLDACTRNGY